MTYPVTEEQRLLVDTARGFARKLVKPVAARIDREERTPPCCFSCGAEAA